MCVTADRLETGAMAHAQAQAQAEVQQQCTRTHSLQTVMGLVRTVRAEAAPLSAEARHECKLAAPTAGPSALRPALARQNARSLASISAAPPSRPCSERAPRWHIQTAAPCVQSISHVCWLRGLFPEDYFTEQKLQHLELSLQQLRADHDDTRRLQAWINTDVQMALEHGYLARLHLCICEDMQGTSVIEQYSYAFTYGTDAGAKCKPRSSCSPAADATCHI